MQLENNLENKAKLFAQYFAQNVRIWQSSLEETWNVSYACLRIDSIQYSILKLKPLSSIIYEDAKEVCMLSRPDVKWKNYSKGDIQNLALRLHQYSIISYQYLQSKGYALPFHNLSVDQMVEYGWIKLIE